MSINKVVLSATRSSYDGKSAVSAFWLDLVVALGTSDFDQRGGDGTTIAGIHDSPFSPVASVTISVISSQTTCGYVLKPRRMRSSYQVMSQELPRDGTVLTRR